MARKWKLSLWIPNQTKRQTNAFPVTIAAATAVAISRGAEVSRDGVRLRPLVPRCTLTLWCMYSTLACHTLSVYETNFLPPLLPNSRASLSSSLSFPSFPFNTPASLRLCVSFFYVLFYFSAIAVNMRLNSFFEFIFVG